MARIFLCFKSNISSQLKLCTSLSCWQLIQKKPGKNTLTKLQLTRKISELDVSYLATESSQYFFFSLGQHLNLSFINLLWSQWSRLAQVSISKIGQSSFSSFSLKQLWNLDSIFSMVISKYQVDVSVRVLKEWTKAKIGNCQCTFLSELFFVNWSREIPLQKCTA